MLGMSDPGVDVRIDIVNLDCSRQPSVAQAAQAFAETPHVVLGKAAATVSLQLKTEEMRRLAA